MKQITEGLKLALEADRRGDSLRRDQILVQLYEISGATTAYVDAAVLAKGLRVPPVYNSRKR